MATTASSKDYLTDAEVVERWPGVFTKSFLRNDRCTKRHGIPFLKIGAKVRYRPADIERYLEKCRRAEG